MAVKQRGVKYLTVNFSDGKTLSVRNYYTHTRNGVCETSVANFDGDNKEYKGRYSWINRPWQSFDYECAMRSMIGKLPKKYQEQATKVLIDKTQQTEEQESEAMYKDFESSYNALSENGKKIFSNSFVNSKEEAEQLTALMKLASIMGV